MCRWEESHTVWAAGGRTSPLVSVQAFILLYSGPARTVRLSPVTLTSRLVGVPRPLRLYEAEPPRRCGSGIPLIREDLLPRVGKQVVDGAPVGIPIHRKWATAAEDSLCRQTATVTK